MSLTAYTKRFAYKQGKAVVRSKYGEQAADAYKYLFSSKSKAQAQTSPSAILAKTPLRSYLDKRYARKCGVEVRSRFLNPSITLTSSLTNVYSPTATIAQGITEVTRVGDSLEIKSYKLQIMFRAGALATNTTFVRMFLIKVGKSEGTNPSGGEIIDTVSSIISPLTSVTHVVVQPPFTILKELNFKLEPFGQTGADKIITINYKPKGCHSLQFVSSDASGNIVNIVEGQMALYGMYAGAAAPTTTTTYDSLEWVDM